MRTVRRVVGWVVAGLLLAVVLALAPFVLHWSSAVRDTSGAVDFVEPLPVPPLAASRVEPDGTRVFGMAAREGAEGTWGFDADHLGPTLRAARGERVRVEVTNGLPETTNVHWHGMHLPAAADGGPHQPIPPGATWAPEWTVDQPAATLWYHAHPHGDTARHTYRGLAGLFLLDDDEGDEGAATGLPQRYGVDDVPLIVTDREVDDAGRPVDPHQGGFFAPSGHLGDTVLVNGVATPFLDVTTGTVRLRLLNASGARTYAFGLADDRDLTLVGTDGGLLDEPHRTDRVRLSPGERAEVLVDVTPGERLALRSFPHDLGTDPFNQRYAGGDDTLDVLELRAAPVLAPSPGPAPRPATVTDDVVAPGPTRRFDLGGVTINGRSTDMSRVDFAVERGATEVWEVRGIAAPHNFHVHGTSFRVLDVDGDPPPPELAGAKDTLYLAPERTYRLLVRFDVPSDPDTPFMVHCHLLAHEDRGMMLQFVVVEPGQQPGVPPSSPVGHHDHGG